MSTDGAEGPMGTPQEPEPEKRSRYGSGLGEGVILAVVLEIDRELVDAERL